MGFNSTAVIVKETSGSVSIPIVRQGDVSQPFSVICHTKSLTAIEDVDYVGRYTLEQSRIYFEAGEKVKFK